MERRFPVIIRTGPVKLDNSNLLWRAGEVVLL